MGVHRGTFYTINVEALRPAAGPEIAIAGSRLMEGFRFIDPKTAVNPRHLEFVHYLAHFEARPNPDADASLELRADRKLRLVEWPEAYDGGRMPDAVALLPHCNGGYRSHDGIYLAISSFIAPAGELDAAGLLRAAAGSGCPEQPWTAPLSEAATACGRPARELAGSAEVEGQLVRFRMRRRLRRHAPPGAHRHVAAKPGRGRWRPGTRARRGGLGEHRRLCR